MWKVTWRGLVAHKLRFLLTAISVVLGVAFVSGTLVFTDTVRKSFDQLFASVFEGTDAYVRSSNVIEGDFGPSQRKRVSDGLVPKVQAVAGVGAAEGQLQILRAQYLNPKGKPIGDPGSGNPTLGFNWQTVRKLNPYTLVPYRGTPSRAPAAAHEVVMDLGTAKEGGFRIGDTVTVLFTNERLPRDRFRIVGVTKFGDADRPLGATIALFTLSETQRVNGTPGLLDGVLATSARGVSQPDLVARIRRAVTTKGVQVITGTKLIEERQSQIQKNLSFFTNFLLIFAGIALFVGSFIIVNTFSIVITQRTRELALLRALGASGEQVRRSVLIEAVLVGFFSSLLGVGFGLLLAVGLRALLGVLGFDVPTVSLVVKSSTVVIALVLGVVVTFAAAILPAFRAARIAPMEALRSAAVESRRLGRRSAIGAAVTLIGAVLLYLGLSGGGGVPAVGAGVIAVFIGVAILAPVFARPVARFLGAPLTRLRGMPGTLARENAVRNPRRTASTAAALMIGVALVGVITIFAGSLKQSLSGQIDRAFRADLVVLGDGGPGLGFSPALRNQVAKVPGVAVASPLRFGPFEVGGSNQFIFAIAPKTIGEVLDLRPQRGVIADLGPNDLAVSTKVFAENHWKLGQKVATRFPVGGRQPMRIAAVYGFGQREGFADYLTSLGSFDRRETVISDNQVFLRLAPGTTVKEVTLQLKKIVAKFPGTKLQDQNGLKDQLNTQINQLLGLIFGLLFLAVFIALLGIMNTLLLSIVERTREIGLLRAIGMTRRQVRTSVRWESIIVAVFGALLGVSLGIFFGWALVRALRDQGFTELVVPGGQLAIVVVLAAIAGVLTAAYPARRASRFDVLDAISTD